MLGRCVVAASVVVRPKTAAEQLTIRKAGFNLLRSFRNMLRFACSAEYLPLTLTLSVREREQQASDRPLAEGRWADFGMSLIERQWTIPPLLRGAGRGEGEPSMVHPTLQSVCAREFFTARSFPFEASLSVQRPCRRFSDHSPDSCTRADPSHGRK